MLVSTVHVHNDTILLMLTYLACIVIAGLALYPVCEKMEDHLVHTVCDVLNFLKMWNSRLFLSYVMSEFGLNSAFIRITMTLKDLLPVSLIGLSAAVLEAN